jgi:hypothetical protein
MLLVCFLLVTSSPFGAATQAAYAQQDADQLRALLDRADSRADSLLVRYRLYPLTEDEEVLQDLPASLSDGTAREYALLSGLWAYRAGEAGVFSAVQYGRRSTDLLETAKGLDPDTPFVLLVEGQSLLFRPAIAGRDPAAAAERFAELSGLVETHENSAISYTESKVWQWLALREAGQSDQAQSLRRRLRARDLPPLYREFLESPPDV